MRVSVRLSESESDLADASSFAALLCLNKGCLDDTLVGGIGSWFTRGSQGMLFDPVFLQQFLKSFEGKEKLDNPDMELTYYCTWHPGDCLMAKPSVIQHLGLASAIFGDLRSNTRFHHAKGVPLTQGTIVNNTGSVFQV